MLKNISRATQNNWRRLQTDGSGKLTKRANKTMSTRRVVASNYVVSDKANQLLSLVSGSTEPLSDIMYTLCLYALRHHQLADKPHVKESFSGFHYHKLPDFNIDDNLWNDDTDLLGFVYQSLTIEGKRNKNGQYYTQHQVVDDMLNGLTLRKGETFLDPCCGSGAFLLSVSTDYPEQLYGTDIDPIAVMIATTNLLIKFCHHQFVPHVYCQDFIDRGFLTSSADILPSSFDYIYTNPPWGADKEGRYQGSYPDITSKERASIFLVQSLTRLKPEGHLGFLLPMSLLKIKTHEDIRRYLLRHSTIKTITLYDGRFDGVFTEYFSICLSKQHYALPYYYDIRSASGHHSVKLSDNEIKRGEIIYDILDEIDQSIVAKIESLRHDDFSHSEWALGIVTGNNKEKVKSLFSEGMEPVYAGKEINAFTMNEVSSYVHFSPNSFQQCAKEEMYRRPEKLIYRFIAKYPIVAYDNQQRLCLNSANILIPSVDGLSVKSVAALLNSSLYRYYYKLKFTDIKVLKGNLQQLPFPLLSSQQNNVLTDIVEKIVIHGYTNDDQKTIDKMIYSLFNINKEEQQHISLKLKNNEARGSRNSLL